MKEKSELDKLKDDVHYLIVGLIVNTRICRCMTER